MPESSANPILNGPYDQPDQYFEIGPQGPTGDIKSGRRPSESYIPIAQAKKGAQQTEIDFDLTGERRERNSLINDLRREVGTWRQQGYNRVTPTTRKLLQHWAEETRENRVLFWPARGGRDRDLPRRGRRTRRVHRLASTAVRAER